MSTGKRPLAAKRCPRDKFGLNDVGKRDSVTSEENIESSTHWRGCQLQGQRGPAVATELQYRLAPIIDSGTTHASRSAHLLDSFFGTVNKSIHCIFPQKSFMTWLKSSEEKSPDEFMTVNATVAMASVFADQGYAETGRIYAEKAMKGFVSTVGRFGLPVLHTRLLLSLYSLAQGDVDAAWDFCGLAIRATIWMRHNHEVSSSDLSDQKRPSVIYGMEKAQLEECRRRTFWTLFLMDRCSEFNGQVPCEIDATDVSLRLPCVEESYVRGMPSEAPFFHGGIVDEVPGVADRSTPVSPLACLIELATIWGNVVKFLARTRHSHSSARESYEETYSIMTDDLLHWNSRLPGYMEYNKRNLDRSVEEDYANIFVFSHILHQFTLIKLHHHMCHIFGPTLLSHGAYDAVKHARILLRISSESLLASQEIACSEPDRLPHFSFSIPLSGHMVLFAVDIISTGDTNVRCKQNLIAVEGGVKYLSKLGQSWRLASDQSQKAEHSVLQFQQGVSLVV